MQLLSSLGKTLTTTARRIILDLIVLTAIFAASHYIKSGNFYLQNQYYMLYLSSLLYWVLLSIYNKKYWHFIRNNRIEYWKSGVWTVGFYLFLTTLTISIVGFTNISRVFLATIALLFLGYDLLLGFVINNEGEKKVLEENRPEQATTFRETARIKYIVPSALWVLIIFFLLDWVKTSNFYYYEQSELVLLVLFTSWGLSTLLTYRYSGTNQRNIYYYITPYVKAGILMILFVSIFYFFFRLEPLSRFLLFGTAIVHSCLEVAAFSILFLRKHVDMPGGENLYSNGVQKSGGEKLVVKPPSTLSDNQVSLREILVQAFPSANEMLAQFYTTVTIAKKFSFEDVQILSTKTTFNIAILKDESYQIIANKEKINNFRKINVYLLCVHDKIKAGGWLIGNFVALEDDWYRLRAKMPKLIFSILYPFYFILHRVMPKIPYAKNIYFVLTKGRNRKLSRAEVLGRLAFTGFKVMNEVWENGVSYFIAQKIKAPLKVRNPSYGPVIKLERIGYRAERINIYKFRTMHPYSEFIQKEVFEQNDINEKGKIRDDFRVTVWGKFIRKMWIDELPQLLNWFRGDISIVGVRALSEHYFSMYPVDLQSLRTKIKPGLIPPYYADMPSSFEDILESERRYLLLKQQHPIKTDIVYLGKAVYNILIRGVRSS